MRVSVIKKWNKADIEFMISEMENRHGSLASLSQKVLISKCASPEKMNDYVIWKYLTQGAELKDIIIVEDPRIFEVLSPRRAELLEYLKHNDVNSIKNLAQRLKRNYKNVYDDLRALADYELVELKQVGRSLMPRSAVESISIEFGD